MAKYSRSAGKDVERAVRREKKGKLKSTKSSNQSSALLPLAAPFLRPPGSIPFHKICCFEEELRASFAAAPSFTGQPNKAGSAEEALEAIESTQRCVIPRVSARGINFSQDFKALIESLRLLRTDCERNLSVLEIRLSSEHSSVISRNSPAQRSGATLPEFTSIFTP